MNMITITAATTIKVSDDLNQGNTNHVLLPLPPAPEEVVAHSPVSSPVTTLRNSSPGCSRRFRFVVYTPGCVRQRHARVRVHVSPFTILGVEVDNTRTNEKVDTKDSGGGGGYDFACCSHMITRRETSKRRRKSVRSM